MARSPNHVLCPITCSTQYDWSSGPFKGDGTDPNGSHVNAKNGDLTIVVDMRANIDADNDGTRIDIVCMLDQ